MRVCPTKWFAMPIRNRRWLRIIVPVIWYARSVAWWLAIVSSMSAPNGEHSAMKNRASIHLVLVVRKIRCSAVVICRRWSDRAPEPPHSIPLEVCRFISANNIINIHSHFVHLAAAKYQNRRTMSSSDRALIAAFKEISTMADRINLPKTIVDRANNLFKQVHDGKNLKGRSNDAKASACLYIACRQEGVPRTFKEICAVSKISKKEIGRCFKLTLKALATSVDLITTADFMSRFCANLGEYILYQFRNRA